MIRPFLWAHRGASARAPENTMTAFAFAVASGADGIELDVHLTHDAVPVVIHDETLDRTTNGTGLVAAIMSRDILQLDAGSWFAKEFVEERVPLLDQVLKVFSGQIAFNLEVKDMRAGQQVLEAVEEFRGADIVVSSFDRNVLKELRAKSPALPLAVLHAEGNWRRSLLLAIELSARSFHPSVETVTRPMLDACQRAGIPVHAWTVDVPSIARSLLRAGASGFFVNDPDAIARAFFVPRDKS